MAELDEHDQIAQRQAKLAELREQGSAFPNDFRRDSLAADLHREHGALGAEMLESNPIRVAVADG